MNQNSVERALARQQLRSHPVDQNLRRPGTVSRELAIQDQRFDLETREAQQTEIEQNQIARAILDGQNRIFDLYRQNQALNQRIENLEARNNSSQNVYVSAASNLTTHEENTQTDSQSESRNRRVGDLANLVRLGTGTATVLNGTYQLYRYLRSGRGGGSFSVGPFRLFSWENRNHR